MNLAEQILRRKHAAMYKPPVVQSQEQVITPAPNTSPRQRPTPNAPVQQPTGVNPMLTPDGRIRMSDINVDLDL